MIPQRRLEAEQVRESVEQVLSKHLRMKISGYKCDKATLLAVLVKAAIEGQTIESVCEDAALGMASNALRESLNRALDVSALREQEVEVNAGLTVCIPRAMPRRGLEMALDWRDEPFYGKTPELRLYAVRGQAKEGTTHFCRIASLYVIWRQVRITLALTYMRPEDSNLYVVQRLMEQMHHLSFRPGVVYMDKEFCEGAIIGYLTQQHLPAILACPIRGKHGTRALCQGCQAYLTHYTFSDGTPARQALYPSRVPDKTGRRRLKWLAFVVIYLDWSARKVYQRYRCHFGIESSYRQFWRLRARILSRNPTLRFLLLGLAFTSTQHLGYAALALYPRPCAWSCSWHEQTFRLHCYIAFLRRAIEHFIGTTDFIPLYAP